MPASSVCSGRPGVGAGVGTDALQQTVLFSALAAVAWWLAMPFSAEPIAVLPLVASFCWPWLLVRAAVGASRRRTVAITLFVSFLVPWAFLLGWIREVSVAGWPALVAYSAVYMPVFALVVRAIMHSPRLQRVPLALVAAVVWTALEYLRAEIILDAWPFYLAAHGVYPSWLIHWAGYAGVWLVSFLIVLTSVGLWQSCLQRGTWKRNMGLIVLGFTLPILPGRLLLGRADTRRSTPVRMLCVQTNLSQSNKIGWPVERQEADVRSFLDQTRTAFQEAGAVDLVLWPETMVPGLGFDPGTLSFLDSLGPGAAHMTRWQRVLQQVAAQSGVPWLVGSPTWLDVTLSDDGYMASSQRFNSAVLLEPGGGVQRYDKVFLTPFGETMPWIRAWPWLEQRLMAVGASGLQFDLQAGKAPVAITIETHQGLQDSRNTVDTPGRTLRLVTPICFEDAVPSVVRALVRDTNADIIVNLSNDGWFGTDDAGRRAHEIAAAFRAVELQRPLIRVANTGLTASINRDGSVVQRLIARTAGTLLVEPDSSRGLATGYARFGNWFPQLLLFLTVVGVLMRYVDRRRVVNPRTECSTEGPTCDVN